MRAGAVFGVLGLVAGEAFLRIGVALEGRLTAVERLGVAGLLAFVFTEGLGLVGVLSSSFSEEGIACIPTSQSLSAPSAFRKSLQKKGMRVGL